MTENMSRKEPLFREEALEKLSSSDQIDRLMVVITSRGWVALICLFVLILSTLIWSMVGKLPALVTGPGIAMTDKGTFNIVTPQSGIITEFPVMVGDWVGPQTLIAKLSDHNIYSYAKGQILETFYTQGDWVSAGDILAWAKYPLEAGESHFFYVFFFGTK